MANYSSFSLSSEIVFGSGCAESVGGYARRLGASRALVVSDAVLATTGLLDRIVAILRQDGVEAAVYKDVEPEPSTESVRPAVDFARQESPEVVVGLGGGSVLDTAKAIGMLLGNGGRVDDYLGTDLVRERGIPTILMPTTAGTGAELSRNALFFVPLTKSKQAIISPLIVSPLAIIDPCLTLSMPPSVTASSGMDALCHAIESYTGLNANPLTDAYSLEAIRLIALNLRQAVFRGHDLAAREAVALASLYAAIALTTAGTNGVHALAYPLQGLKRVPHGLANAVLLPYVMEFNAPASLERFVRIAQQMGQPAGHLSQREAASGGIAACRQLAEDIGIPLHLHSVGIESNDLDPLVAGAVQVTRLLKNNPRPMSGQDIKMIFQRAF